MTSTHTLPRRPYPACSHTLNLRCPAQARRSLQWCRRCLLSGRSKALSIYRRRQKRRRVRLLLMCNGPERCSNSRAPRPRWISLAKCSSQRRDPTVSRHHNPVYALVSLLLPPTELNQSAWVVNDTATSDRRS